MGKRPFLLASGCYFFAAASSGVAVAAYAPSTPSPPRGRLGMNRRDRRRHHRAPARWPFGHRRLSTASWRRSDGVVVALRSSVPSDESIVDPLDALQDATAHLPPSSSSASSSWGVGDDWNTLSSADIATASPASFSSSSGHYDATDEAARLLEEHEAIMNEWDAGEDGASAVNDATRVRASDGDDFVEDAVDVIASHSDYDDTNLYDTAFSSSSSTKEEKAGGHVDQEEEIAFMIRCNQSPEQFLVSQGRALPELTDEVKYSPDFLLVADDDVGRLPLQPKSTAFFERAVEKIFDEHSVRAEETDVMDRGGISKWMTKCISSPLAASSSKPFVIGPYDRSISATLSRYSMRHGSGTLTLPEFRALYLEVAWYGYVRDVIHGKEDGGKGHPLPSPEAGVLIHGKKNTEKMLKHAALSLVWRDLEAHEVFSPAEEERVAALLEMERLRAETRLLQSSSSGANPHQLMDECELFDDYEERLLHRVSHSEDNDDDALGTEGGWDFLERKEKSSHKSVEMASDGKTPKRIRDGKFVFIDEESCIGCTQCAQIAPSTFKMIEDTGRARTYSQSNALDVENAVMACPVTCMHWLSFDELKEMETSRDDGDGRTDHRHFGGRITHTPLHVAGRGSDANHKSSWYHYLKWKCHGSSSCPQRGCYDCPTYASGQNPFFVERHKQAELTRAKDFMESGEADKWRKVVEL